MRGDRRSGATTLLAATLLASAATAQSGPALPGGLVHLADIDTTILQDMRYAGPANFTGRPVPGYEAGACILLRPVAEALARVQREVARRGMSLKVYDCYRPERAVRAFHDWVAAPEDGRTRHYYPRLTRDQLHEDGYISRDSAHSRGIAVDLTLVVPDRPRALPVAARSRPPAPCTAPADTREADDGVDMGTAYDCFDVKSHTHAGGLTSEQRRWRDTLVAAMRRHGFRNYPREWWHFTFGRSDGPAFDVPVRAKAAR